MLAQRLRAPNSAAQQRPRRSAVAVRAVAEPAVKDATKLNGNGNGKPARKPEHFINVIPKTAWEKGIPLVMGAHLMASGVIAPISTSKGAGDGVDEHQFQYPGEGAAQVVVYATPKNAAKGLAKQIAALAADAIKAKGAFTVALPGGSVLSTLGALAETPGVDFSKWWFAFVDERNVPLSSADSNYAGAKEALLGKIPVPESQVLAIREGLTVQQAATEYEGRLLGLPAGVLPRAGGLPVFDLVVLGVGPDGHVASLFPNRPELAAAADGGPWVLPVTKSPKPPAERITLSLPVINAAKEVLVVAIGESKAEIVQRALEVQALPGALPVQLVRPTAGRARWILDAMSAQELNIGEWENSKDFPRNK